MLYESVPEAEYVADMPEVYKTYMVRMTVKGLTKLRMYKSIGCALPVKIDTKKLQKTK